MNVEQLEKQIEELKAERNRICKKLKKLRQRLNKAKKGKIENTVGYEVKSWAKEN